jgi:tRNA(Ile)-lysidine synthase
VLVAHIRDDLRETALMRVLRGSGPAGLAGMPAARGIIRRPLIASSRADVIAYLKERGISWRSDASNADNRYFRNRIRNRLVPLLEEFVPGWGRGLDALGETQALIADFITDEARRRVLWEPWSPGEAPGLRTGAENFFALPEILREEALFQGINTLWTGTAEAGTVRRQNLRRFCRDNGPQETGDLDLGFCRVRREAGFIVIAGVSAGFFGEKRVEETGFSLLIKEPGAYKLTLYLRPEPSAECGARGSLPGIRQSGEDRTLTVCPLSVVPEDAGKNGFIAALPLVLRSAYSDDVIAPGDGRRLSLKELRGTLPKSRRGIPVTVALDSRGLAAFIGSPGILWRRGAPGGTVLKAFSFSVSGGIDDQ